MAKELSKRATTRQLLVDSPAPTLPLQDKLQRPFSDELWAQPSHNFGPFTPQRVCAPPGFPNIVWALAKEIIRYNVNGNQRINAFAAHFFSKLVAKRNGESVDRVQELMTQTDSMATESATTKTVTAVDATVPLPTEGVKEVRESGDGQEDTPVFHEDSGLESLTLSADRGEAKAEGGKEHLGEGRQTGPIDVSICFSGPALEQFWLDATEAGDFAAKQLNLSKKK